MKDIIKRLWYFTLAMGWITWTILETTIKVAYKTLYEGQKIHWVYAKDLTPAEAGGVMAYNHVTDEEQFIPLDDYQPRKVNRYHLRYNWSSRGV